MKAMSVAASVVTDAHFHRNGFETYLTCRGREVRFRGVHPWQVTESVGKADLRAILAADAQVGVGEIGLDRLKTKIVPDDQRTVFAEQLALAAEFGRPVVLHGAKCWGEVVKACLPYQGRIPAFLFHGFSRSVGLLPEIVALNGFVSLGPALLNNHAVNYHEMSRDFPLDRLLLETDKDWSVEPAEGEPSQEVLLTQMAEKLTHLRNCSREELTVALDANAARFIEALV